MKTNTPARVMVPSRAGLLQGWGEIPQGWLHHTSRPHLSDGARAKLQDGVEGVKRGKMGWEDPIFLMGGSFKILG